MVTASGDAGSSVPALLLGARERPPQPSVPERRSSGVPKRLHDDRMGSSHGLPYGQEGMAVTRMRFALAGAEGDFDILNIREYLRENSWILGYYPLVLLALVIQDRLSIAPTIGTILLILLFVIPFILPRLSSFEYGGLKVEMRDLRDEVRETKEDVRREVSEVRQGYEVLNAQLNELLTRSRDYLQRQPLSVSDEKIQQMRDDMRHSAPLSEKDLLQGLNNPDASVRVAAYLELQVRPNANVASNLIDCFWWEQLEARKSSDTRPLWQLLVAVERCLLLSDEPIKQVDYRRLELLMHHCLQFLEETDSVDQEGQCKDRLQILLTYLPATDSKA